jgi:hypothetical protein
MNSIAFSYDVIICRPTLTVKIERSNASVRVRDLIFIPLGIGLMIFNHEPEILPGFKAECLSKMEWSMIISFAGPFAEAFSRKHRSRNDKRPVALLSCGAIGDYNDAEAVLADYKEASKRRYGIRHFEDLAWDLVVANQPAISALASELFQRETLEYNDAYKIAAKLLVPVMPVRSLVVSTMS